MRFSVYLLSTVFSVHSYLIPLPSTKSHTEKTYSRCNAVAESALASLVAGGLAGSVGVGAAYPFDSIKVCNMVTVYSCSR